MSQLATAKEDTAVVEGNDALDSIQADASSIQLVSFRVGEILLGIDIRYVQEINRLLDVTPVPGAPDRIHGVVNLRGDVVTVLDLHRIFELPPTATPQACRNLVLRVGGERIGIMVDQVSDIINVKLSDLSGRPSNIGSVDRQFIDSVYLNGDEIVVLLNAEQLIAAIDTEN